jgi:hypothetical protein
LLALRTTIPKVQVRTAQLAGKGCCDGNVTTLQAWPVRPAPDRSSGRHDATNQEHHRRPVDPQAVTLAKAALAFDMPIVMTSSQGMALALVPLLAADPPMLAVY